MRISVFFSHINKAVEQGSWKNNAEALTDLASQGLECVDVNGAAIGPMYDLKELKKELDDSGIKTSSIFHFAPFDWKDENILENINLRKFIKLYNEFYKNNLSSAYEVAHKEKTYINEEKNNKIISHFEKNGNLDEYLEKVIDNYFIDYKNQNNIPKENINNVLITQEKNKLYKILHNAISLNTVSL